MISPHAKAPDISAALDLIEGTQPSDWNETDLTFIQAISDLQRFATSLQITLTEQAMQISDLTRQIAALQRPETELIGNKPTHIIVDEFHNFTRAFWPEAMTADEKRKQESKGETP